MTEIIEVNSILTDAYVRELRVGDVVESIIGGMQGIVVEISQPEGEIVGEPEHGQVSVERPPLLTVQFSAHHLTVDFQVQFLRAAVWRWQCLEVKRV